VIVTCAPQTDSHQVTDPCLIVEVVSPTTAQIDRGEKRMAYLQLPSLRHFLLVDHEAGTVEHLARVDEHSPWLFAQADATMTLEVDCPAPTVIDVAEVLGIAEFGSAE
jgi:Uma2 family endonuclease